MITPACDMNLVTRIYKQSLVDSTEEDIDNIERDWRFLVLMAGKDRVNSLLNPRLKLASLLLPRICFRRGRAGSRNRISADKIS